MDLIGCQPKLSTCMRVKSARSKKHAFTAMRALLFFGLVGLSLYATHDVVADPTYSGKDCAYPPPADKTVGYIPNDNEYLVGLVDHGALEKIGLIVISQDDLVKLG